MGQTATQQITTIPAGTPVVKIAPTPAPVNPSPIDSLAGYKTYIVAGLMILYALSGYTLHDLTQPQAMTLVLQALAVAGLRNGLQTGINSLKAL